MRYFHRPDKPTIFVFGNWQEFLYAFERDENWNPIYVGEDYMRVHGCKNVPYCILGPSWSIRAETWDAINNYQTSGTLGKRVFFYSRH